MSRHRSATHHTLSGLRVLVALLAGLAAFTLAPSPAQSADEPVGRTLDHTRRVVVRPVDAGGHAVDGWTVERERDGKVDCDGASMSSVSDDVYECFPTVEYAVACWKSRDHTVLCLRDPRSKQLVRIAYRGTLSSVSAPERRTPLALTLRRGQHCQVRFGGAWGTPAAHPRWVGFFSCDHGSVYGPGDGDGTDRSKDVWRVHVWRGGTEGNADDIVTRGVRTAYLVGTAG